MKKGLSWLLCLALLLTQFAPLGYAGNYGPRKSTNDKMLATPNDEGWINYTDVEYMIDFLNENPRIAAQYKGVVLAGRDRITALCGHALEHKMVKIGEEWKWKLCNSSLNVQSRLLNVVGGEYAGEEEWLANFQKGVYEKAPQDGRTVHIGATGAGVHAASGMDSDGLYLMNADLYAVIPSRNPGSLNSDEKEIASTLSKLLQVGADLGAIKEKTNRIVNLYFGGNLSPRILRMALSAYADALVSNGKGLDSIWKYIERYQEGKKQQTIAFFAVNAIMLQPQLRDKLTENDWKTIIKITGEELRANQYSAAVNAQQLARLFMLKIGPEAATEQIVEFVKQADGDLEKGLKEAYVSFIAGGRELVQAETTYTIPVTDEESIAVSRASRAVASLREIAQEVCPATMLVDDLLTSVVIERPLVAPAPATTDASVFGGVIVFALDLLADETGENFASYEASNAEAKRIIKAALANESARIQREKQNREEQAAADAQTIANQDMQE